MLLKYLIPLQYSNSISFLLHCAVTDAMENAIIQWLVPVFSHKIPTSISGCGCTCINSGSHWFHLQFSLSFCFVFFLFLNVNCVGADWNKYPVSQSGNHQQVREQPSIVAYHKILRLESQLWGLPRHLKILEFCSFPDLPCGSPQ